MITNLVLFVSFLTTAFVLGQIATASQAGRRPQPIRIKIEDRRG